MTAKAEFNAEEWSKVVVGPFVAGLVVIAADRGGSIRETVAMAKVFSEQQQAGDNPELIKELLGERPNAETLKGEGANPEEALREALDILEAKATPEEVDAYKRLCLEIAQRVAERTKSGGVLGIGGERVSGEEQTAVERLRATLGL